MIAQIICFLMPLRSAMIAIAVLRFALDPAAASAWEAMHLKAPGGQIKEIRQAGDRTFVHADGRWWEIEACAEHRFCFTRRTPPRQQKAPAGGLPDGKVASLTNSSGPASAWYDKPTKKYGHGILGDAIEAERLNIKTADGRKWSIDAGQGHVFEDLTPRLADLDGDGSNEVIAIRSNLRKGAAVAVYGIADGTLELLASTPPVGLANRWRNPSVFIDDPRGNGKLIGEVVTPHIGGTFRLWSFSGSTQTGYQLEPRGSAYGFSNHAIGSRQLALSAVLGDFLAVPSADRRAIRILRVSASRLKTVNAVDVPGQISHAVGVISENGSPIFLAGLSDGRLFTIGLLNEND